LRERLVPLPSDAVLLPLSSGRLLVSRGHAVFCRVPSDSVEAVERVLAGGAEVAGLPDPLLSELDRHGFFGPPRSAKRPDPSVQLQLTNACNLTCTYCCTNSAKPRREECTLERLSEVVRETREVLGPRTRVAILGGEPFLVPWAADLADLILDLDLVLTIFSNGLPLRDPALAERVAGLTKRGAELRISLGGATRETCDTLSGIGRFDEAIAGMNALVAAGGTLIADVMLLPQHVAEVAEHLPALRRRLPPRTKLTFGVLYLSGRETGDHLFGSRTDLEAALDRIAFEAGERIAATPTEPVVDRREGCSCAMGHHLHVRSDGVLFNCFKMEETVGDLRNARFADVLEAVRSRPHRAADLALCADCPLATLCGGGCRSENLQYTGDPDRPICGPWRIRVISELLAEDRAACLEWPAPHLLSEARQRGIAGPERLVPAIPSRHLIDT
jgi:radical SAM protein with 4Fe4S-binding SPASM domain